MKQKQDDPAVDRGFHAAIPRIVRIGYSILTPMQKWLYVCLKDLCGEHGTCYRTIKVLAQETGISTGMLSMSIPILQREGLIQAEKKKRSDGGKEVWHITIVDIWAVNRKLYPIKRSLTEQTPENVHSLNVLGGERSLTEPERSLTEPERSLTEPERSLVETEEESLEEESLEEESLEEDTIGANAPARTPVELQAELRASAQLKGAIHHEDAKIIPFTASTPRLAASHHQPSLLHATAAPAAPSLGSAHEDTEAARAGLGKQSAQGNEPRILPPAPGPQPKQRSRTRPVGQQPESTDMVSPDAEIVIARWFEAMKKPYPRTEGLCKGAELLAPCNPSVKDLQACRGFCFQSNPIWFRDKKHGAVTLLDVAKNWEAWQSSLELPSEEQEVNKDYSDFDRYVGNGPEERAQLEREYYERLANGNLA